MEVYDVWGSFALRAEAQAVLLWAHFGLLKVSANDWSLHAVRDNILILWTFFDQVDYDIWSLS